MMETILLMGFRSAEVISKAQQCQWNRCTADMTTMGLIWRITNKQRITFKANRDSWANQTAFSDRYLLKLQSSLQQLQFHKLPLPTSGRRECGWGPVLRPFQPCITCNQCSLPNRPSYFQQLKFNRFKQLSILKLLCPRLPSNSHTISHLSTGIRVAIRCMLKLPQPLPGKLQSLPGQIRPICQANGPVGEVQMRAQRAACKGHQHHLLNRYLFQNLPLENLYLAGCLEEDRYPRLQSKNYEFLNVYRSQSFSLKYNTLLNTNYTTVQLTVAKIPYCFHKCRPSFLVTNCLCVFFE